MRQGWSAPVHVIIFAVFSLLFVVALGSLIWWNHHKSSEAALDIADKLLLQVSDKIYERVDNIFTPLKASVNLSSENMLFAHKPGINLYPPTNYLLDILHNHHQSDHVFLAYSNDELYSVFLTERLPQSVHEQLSLPEGTEILIRQNRKVGSSPYQIWKFFDGKLGMLGHNITESSGYGHLDSKWYRQAEINTDPITFGPLVPETSGRYSLRIVKRFDGEISGVFGVDIPLSLLDRFLQSQKIDQDSQISVISEDGTVYASTEIEPGSLENGANVLRHVSHHSGGPLHNIFNRHIQEEKSLERSIRFYVRDKEYISRIRKLDSIQKQNTFLVITAPARVFTQKIEEARTSNIYYSVAVLIILFPILMYISKFLTQPLRILTEKAGHLRRSDSGDQIIVDSRIDEIRQLSNVLNLAKRMETLLDNSDQAFLSFGSNLIINEERSQISDVIFETYISGLHINSLLYPDSEKEAQLFAGNISTVLSEEDDFTRNMIIELLPTEIKRKERYLKVQYKYLNSNHMMLIISDITEERKLEETINIERSHLRMIINAVNQPDEYREVISEFMEFLKKDFHELVFSQKDQELYRAIHTFKGNFSQLDMVSTVSELHYAEDIIRNTGKTIDSADSLKLISPERLESGLQEDVKILSQILGIEYFSKLNNCEVDPEKIQGVWVKLRNLYQDENQNIIIDKNSIKVINDVQDILESMLYKNANDLLKKSVSKAEHIAIRLGKQIYPIAVNGGEDIFLNENKAKSFFKTLVHVFNNCIDHGIEIPHLREKEGKPPKGTVTCDVWKKDGNLFIRISDDGKGIDTLTLLEQAMEKGLLENKSEYIDSPEKAYHFIFIQSISTKKVTTHISGRGVGLAAVKQELEKLHGDVRVKSQVGEGTSFEFIIPMMEIQ